MRKHHKKRFPFLNCRYLNDVAFADLAVMPRDTGQSSTGEKYAIIIVLRDGKYVFVDTFKKKTDAYEALKKFFIKEGVPLLMVMDGEGELAGEDQESILIKHHCKGPNHSEPKIPWQKRAERFIGHIKEMTERLLDYNGVPDKYWIYAIKHAAAIHNHTLYKSTNNKTPWELVKSDTPDISPF